MATEQTRDAMGRSPQRTFTIVVERDPASGWLVGEVVELPGCYTQAPDAALLETSIREAIAAYLHTAKPDGADSESVGTWQVAFQVSA